MKWRVISNEFDPNYLAFSLGVPGEVITYNKGDETYKFLAPRLNVLPHAIRLSCDDDGEEEKDIPYILIACSDIESQDIFEPQDFFEEIYGIVNTEAWNPSTEIWEQI